MKSSNILNFNGSDDRYSPRQSNIELLRILAMILVVAHHISFHSGFNFQLEVITVNRLWIQFIQIGGKIGVDIFILISGYFLVTALERRTSKLIKLWLQIFTYSILSFTFFIALGMENFSVKELIRHLCPVTFELWWFASTYFVLYLLFPYINKLVKTLDKKQYQKMLVLLTVCWCIIPTFFGQAFQRNHLILFIYLYLLGGYVKIYDIKSQISGERYVTAALILTVLTFFLTVVFDLLGMKIKFFGIHATYFYGEEKLPVILISFLMFIGFCKMDIKYSRMINFISSATFGVYLIHDNRYISEFLWKKVFRIAIFSESYFLIPYTIMVIIIVFVVCTIIELCRINIIEKHYLKSINQLAIAFDYRIEQFLNLKS